jgi:hypothetical protein
MPYCIASTGSLAGSPTTGWCCCHAGSTGCFGADASLPQPDAAPPDARPDHTVNDGSSPDAMATLDARPDHSTLDGGAPHDAPTAREARADGRADDGGHDAGGEGGREAGVDAGCFTEVMGCCNPGDITAQHPCSDYYVDYFSCDQPGGGDMPYCIASTGVLAGSPSTGWCCCHPGSTACFTLDGG